MPASDVANFIRSTFRSVWALELLLVLKRGGDRAWQRAELVEALRASDRVVSSGLDSLLAGGLILVEADGAVRYAPASGETARLADETESVYARKPDAVRRLIVLAGPSALDAFVDAFRLRRD